MNRSCRLLVCNLLLACSLTACSTPGTRARTHATAFHQLSPADRQLVLHGQIRPGMSRDAVTIAWGSPDEKTSTGGKSASETWIYWQRLTIYEPMNAYYYAGPSHGFGNDAAGRGFLPNDAYGGVGYEGVLRYQPHVRSLDSVRIAEFTGGTSRLHPAHHTGTGKSGVRTASVGGSNAGHARPGSHGSHAVRGAHPLGHTEREAHARST